MTYNYLFMLLVALFVTFCVGAEVPVTGLGLRLDLEEAFDLKAHGVHCVAIKGAKPTKMALTSPLLREATWYMNVRLMVANYIL